MGQGQGSASITQDLGPPGLAARGPGGDPPAGLVIYGSARGSPKLVLTRSWWDTFSGWKLVGRPRLPELPPRWLVARESRADPPASGRPLLENHVGLVPPQSLS